MLNREKMIEAVRKCKYDLSIDVDNNIVCLVSGDIDAKCTDLKIERAIEWVNCGISSFEGYSRQKMFEQLEQLAKIREGQ